MSSQDSTEQIFTDDFLTSLPADNLDANAAMLHRFNTWLAGKQLQGATADACLQAWGIYTGFLESRQLGVPQFGLPASKPAAAGAIAQQLQPMVNSVSAQIANRDIQDLLDKGKRAFAMQSGKLFCYQFNEDEITRIQKILNELREIFQKSIQLSEDHRRRLLARLEQLQAELHKRMSDLDRFWGLVGDAGVVLKKFGEDLEGVRKIGDLIYKLGSLIFGAQLTAHGLPPSEPVLLPPHTQPQLPPSTKD